MEKVKQFFRQNPYMGFIAVIAGVTIVLGAMAFTATRPKSDTKKIEPPPAREKEIFSEDAGSDIDSSSHGNDEDDPDPTRVPTKIQATATPASTATPTLSPTPAGTKINLLGKIYEDKNCNNTQDADEDFVRKVLTVNIFKMPGNAAYTSTETDTFGHYSYNGTIDKDSSIDLQPMPVPPDGYKIGKYQGVTKTLNRDTPSQRIDIGLVPTANASACQ